MVFLTNDELNLENMKTKKGIIVNQRHEKEGDGHYYCITQEFGRIWMNDSDLGHHLPEEFSQERFQLELNKYLANPMKFMMFELH